MMSRYLPWMLVFLIQQVYSAEPIPPQKSSYAFRSTSKFRPQPHVVHVEKYHFVVDKTTDDSDASDGDASTQAVQQSLPQSYNQQQLAKSCATVRERIQQALPVIRFDHVDRLIFKTTLPLSTVFAIIPIVGALDLFWVNRLGDTLALAGQAAANQVFNSAFWLFSFLPTITATLVSKSHASGDVEQTQDSVCQAVLFSLLIAIPGGMLMFFNPSRALSSILKGRRGILMEVNCSGENLTQHVVTFSWLSCIRDCWSLSPASGIFLSSHDDLVCWLLDPPWNDGSGIGSQDHHGHKSFVGYS
jgi:MatE